VEAFKSTNVLNTVQVRFGMTYVLLPLNHTLQQQLEVFLKLINPVLLKSGHFGLDQAGALIKLEFSIGGALLGLLEKALLAGVQHGRIMSGDMPLPSRASTCQLGLAGSGLVDVPSRERYAHVWLRRLHFATQRVNERGRQR
jgi:hypothetical protein